MNFEIRKLLYSLIGDQTQQINRLLVYIEDATFMIRVYEERRDGYLEKLQELEGKEQ